MGQWRFSSVHLLRHKEVSDLLNSGGGGGKVPQDVLGGKLGGLQSRSGRDGVKEISLNHLLDCDAVTNASKEHTAYIFKKKLITS